MGLPIKLGRGDYHTYFHVIISRTLPFQWKTVDSTSSMQDKFACKSQHRGTALPLIILESLKHAFQWSYDNGAWLHQALSCLNRVRHGRDSENMWNTNFIQDLQELFTLNVFTWCMEDRRVSFKTNKIKLKHIIIIFTKRYNFIVDLVIHILGFRVKYRNQT